MAYPLSQMLCKDVKWVWNKNCDKAFSALKEQLASQSDYNVNFLLTLASIL